MLLVFLLFPMPALAEERSVPAEQSTENTPEEMSSDEKPSRRTFPDIPNIENLEISIKPKVSETIQDAANILFKS